MTNTHIVGVMVFVLAIGYLIVAIRATFRLPQWGAARFLPLAAIAAYLSPPIINSCFRSFSSRHAIAVYLLALLLLLATALRAWRGHQPLERLLGAGSVLWFILIAADTIHSVR